jgi:hypothetical protein
LYEVALISPSTIELCAFLFMQETVIKRQFYSYESTAKVLFPHLKLSYNDSLLRSSWMKYTVFNQLLQLPSQYLTQSELKQFLEGTDHSRFGVLKRAVAKGLLIRVRRGLYCLSPSFTRKKLHPFELASKIVEPSVISLESALAYHGLISEARSATTSITSGRQKSFKTPFGEYFYQTVPAKNFHLSVERVIEGDAVYHIASPWRAITDYLYCYKKEWACLEAVVEALKLDIKKLPFLTAVEAELLKKYYHHQRVTQFISSVAQQ